MTKGRGSSEPSDAREFTRSFDRFYTATAALYDVALRRLPLWKTWLRSALPYVQGPRVLEVSFGTGYLLPRLATRFETHGLDYNRRMIRVARRNLARAGASAQLVRGDVSHLPYPDGCFDTVVNTMAFSGYPRGARALGELARVLRRGGRLVLIDFSYPRDGNRLGSAVADLWRVSGDVMRDMPSLFREAGLDCEEREIGAWGGLHLYLATVRGGGSRASTKICAGRSV